MLVVDSLCMQQECSTESMQLSRGLTSRRCRVSVCYVRFVFLVRFHQFDGERVFRIQLHLDFSKRTVIFCHKPFFSIRAVPGTTNPVVAALSLNTKRAEYSE
jgi:hypothetical protein